MNDQVRGRRMSDNHVPLDIAQQALAIKEISHSQALLQRDVKSSMDNMNNTVVSLGIDLKRFGEKIESVALVQHMQSENATAIQAIRTDMAAALARIETWKTGVDDTIEAYRVEADREVRAVRENIIRILAWGAAVGAVGGLLLTGAMFWLRGELIDQEQAVAQARAATDEKYRANRELIINNTLEITKNREKVNGLELYLARGGQSPRQPYEATK